MDSSLALKPPPNVALVGSQNGTMTPSPLPPQVTRALSPLIDEIRLACSLPALDDRELVATARIWAEVLLAEGVPMDQWRTCLIRVLRTRKTTFPVSVSELCAAWRELKADQTAERIARIVEAHERRNANREKLGLGTI